MNKAIQTLLASFLLFAAAFYVQDLNSELNDRLDAASNGQGKAFFILPEEANLAQIPQDPKNPLTPEKVALGRLLFHETGLLIGNVKTEGRQTNSCAGCHFAEKGFQADRHQGIGEGGIGFTNRRPNPSYQGHQLDVQPIRPPATLNLGYQTNVLWNGSFGATGVNIGTEALWTGNQDLETNLLGYQGPEIQAIAGLRVHRMPVDENILVQLGYKELFDAAFPDVPSTQRYDREHAGLAIAAYDRTVSATQAPFQSWLKGDLNALTNRQKEGAILFFGEAGCVNCHSGPALNKMEFHALGMNDLYQHPSPVFQADASSPANQGRAGFTKNPADAFKFKTPQLYNLKDVHFYGHGSSFSTIRDVVAYKNTAIPQNTNVPSNALSPYFKPLGLSETQVDAITDFIENGLYDGNLMRYKPENVLSWLNPSVNDPNSREDLDYANYCSMIEVEGGQGQISVNHLDAPICEVTVYDNTFNKITSCLNDCEKNTVFNNLEPGTYYVASKFFSYNWQFICESFVEATVTGSGGGGTGTVQNDCSTLIFDGSNNQITVGGLNGTHQSVQVFNSSWTIINSCWDASCGSGTIAFPIADTGKYYVKVDYYTASWVFACSEFKEVTVTGTTGGGGTTTCQIQTTFAYDIKCGSAEGMITATTTGGTAPYIYVWENTKQGASLWATSGDYDVTITDAAGCTKAFTASLPQAKTITPNITMNGNTVAFAPTGGVAPYAIRWTNTNGYFQWGPLSLTNLPSGAFTATIFDAEWCASTVSFQINAPKVLAAQTLDFQAHAMLGKADMSWVLQGIDIAKSVEVQRTDNLENGTITTLLSVEDFGEAEEYRYFDERDEQPLDGNNFYRLRIIEQSGKVIYSDWKLVYFETRNALSIFPNPVRSQTVLRFDKPVKGAVAIRISNTKGQVLATKSITLNSDQISLDFNGFDNGLYFVSAQEEGKRPQIVQVLVEKGY